MKWWLTIAIIEIIHNYKAFFYSLACIFSNKNENAIIKELSTNLQTKIKTSTYYL